MATATGANPTSAAPSGGHQAQVSENPLDYLSMIAYVRRGHQACEDLVSMVSDRMDVLVQDVDALQGEPPPWLRGVPTVVQLPGREVLTGTKAIDAVESLCARNLLGVDVRVGFAAAGGAPLSESAPSKSQGFASLFVCQEDKEAPMLSRSAPLPMGSAEGRYEDAHREKKNDRTLEDAMRLREGPRTRRLPV
jgi:hypothetical protein